MTTLQKPKGTYADYKSGNFSDKVFHFELTKKYSGDMMKDSTGKPVAFPLTEMFPMTGTIFFQPVSGRGYIRKIRYVEGLKTFYVDEQNEDKDHPFKKVLLEFINGKKQIDGTETVLLDFIFSWDACETKENKDPKKTPLFRLIDTTKLVAQGRKAQKLEFDAVNWCYNALPDKIMPVACLTLNSEQLMQNIEDIRFNLVQMAKRNPQAFNDLLNDPKTERIYVLRQAVERGYLTVNQNMNAVCWTDNPNAPLTNAPMGKDPVTDFVVKSFSGEVEKCYFDIYNLVSPTKSETIVKEELSEPQSLLSEKELLDLIKEGKEKGIITFSKPYWTKYKGEAFKSEQAMISALKTNSNMLSVLKHDLETVAI
jgi:hypothetical protein